MTEKLSTLVDGYIKKRAALKLEPLTKEIQKQEANGQEGLVSSAETDDKLLALQAAFKPSAWLSGAAQRAKQISFVTHPLKFTHGDAKGSSIFAYSQDSIPTGKYLITAAVRQPRIDVDGNAAALDVAGLLQLQAEGSSLGQCIAQGDMSALLPFVENEDQLKEWRQGFELALVNTELRTHTLAKQVYFPCPDGTYHLISPLFASSLAHELFQRVLDSRFSEEAKSLRKLKREKLHSSQTLVEFRSLALQTFGGTKPQNVSSLNSNRIGRSYLLSCQPPSWTKQTQPPSKSGAFWREYERRTWRVVRQFKELLEASLKKSSTVQIRSRRAEFIDELMEIFFQYSMEIQAMIDHAGWSEDSDFPRAEQLWLDPHSKNKSFQEERSSQGWQRDLAKRFSPFG